MAIFGPKPGIYILDRRLSVLEHHKRNFQAYIASNKKFGKMANLKQNPWANPFGKMSIFRLVELFIA